MNSNIIRAWKDAEYRDQLDEKELALLPEHPAGSIELNEEDLLHVVGGGGSQTCCQALSICINTIIC